MDRSIVRTMYAALLLSGCANGLEPDPSDPMGRYELVAFDGKRLPQDTWRAGDCKATGTMCALGGEVRIADAVYAFSFDWERRAGGSVTERGTYSETGTWVAYGNQIGFLPKPATGQTYTGTRRGRALIIEAFEFQRR